MSKVDLEGPYPNPVPCSVQKYINLFDPPQKLSKLSIAQRQLAFQHWVAYELYNNKNTHNRSTFNCPLIGCSISFGNLQSCLAHLSKCAWLSNAWYWCPFCTRPERFTHPQPTSTGQTRPKSPREGSELASIQDQEEPDAKSGAARFLKNLSSKLGLLLQPPVSRLRTDMDAAGQQIHLRSPPRSDQTFAGSTGLTPDTQLALSVDSKAVPRHIFQTAIGGSMLPAELLGDYYIRKSYGPLTAELPSDGYYDNRQPPELDGSTLHTNVAYQWSPSKPTSSDHNAFSGLPWHPKFPVAAKACLPAYTQQPQHMDFPVSYRRDGSPIQTLRSDSGEMALPLFAELDSTMATDTSGPNRPHRSLKAQYGSILDELFVPIYPNADVQNLSQSNEVQSFCSGTTLVQDQLSQQEAPWSPMSSSYLQTGDSEKLQLPSRPSYSGSTPTQESSLSLRIADLALSSHGQAAGDTWGQCFYPAASGSQYAYKAPEDRDETAFESPLPMRLGFAHKEAAPNTSPTESTLSSHRESHGMRSYSNTTLPTSAETSPTSARKPPNISLEAQVPQPRIPGTSKCDSCDTMFTGSFQDRRSNLNRHRKYQHEQQEKFKCLEEGCNKEYSRPDNLRKHCQADHPGAQQLRRRNAHKVRRNF